MTQTLELLKPNLLKTAKETEELIATIQKESIDAEKTRSTVSVEEAACNKKADSCKAIRDECEEALKEALPALEMAAKAVSQINKKELGEIRGMAAPSEKIKKVWGMGGTGVLSTTEQSGTSADNPYSVAPVQTARVVCG